MGSSGTSHVPCTLLPVPRPPFSLNPSSHQVIVRIVEKGRADETSLHATSEPFFHQITKRKPTTDPLPPPGTGKDKILCTEALGLVMIDYGDAVIGGLGMSSMPSRRCDRREGKFINKPGDGMAKYGKARVKMAMVQEEFGNRLNDGYIGNLGECIIIVQPEKRAINSLAISGI